MISKELLNEVLGIYEKDLQEIIIVDNEVFWTGGDINIYELAHKCKEWAFNKGYCIEIELRHNSIPQDTTKCVVMLGKYGCRGVAGTEPEAIFKACRWILAKKDGE